MTTLDYLLIIAGAVTLLLLLARWYVTRLDGLDEWDGEY